MQRTHRFKTRSWTLALASSLLLFAGCGSDVTDPDGGDVSAEARQSAAQSTDEVLRSTQMLETATMVEDLTGGFAVGLADEAAGLDMELGEGFSLPPQSAARLNAGAVIARSAEARKSAARELNIHMSDGGALMRAPGDLIIRFTENNLDGSVSEISIYEGDAPSIVRIVRETSWPNGHLLIASIQDEILADLGADREIESDDIWLALSSTIVFNDDSSLTREIDESDENGIVDDARVEIVTTYVPRPGLPRLVDIVSTLEVDLYQLDTESDDRFVSIDRVSRFSGMAYDGGSPRVVESLALEQPVAEGAEPCGGTLERDIHFRNDRALRRWTDNASWSCEGGGSLSRTVVYDDGSQDSLSLTEDAMGVVHLEASGRDGSSVSGEFDEALHSFEITTVFAQGSDPVQSFVSGSTNDDDTAWTLNEQITYLDGFVENNTLSGSEDENGKSLSGSHQGRDESVSFELESNLDETLLTGFVENDQNQRIEFTLEQLPDESHLVDFVATEPGVRVEGHLEIDADGCGNGTLVITEDDVTVTIDVEFCDGDVEDEAILAGN